MFIQTEETPNPETLKFVPGKIILKKGTLEYKTEKDAQENNLAKLLFDKQYVSNVFIGKDFISITKSKNIDWDLLKPNILSKILDFFSAGGVLEDHQKISSSKKKYKTKDKKIIDEIVKLLDQRIKPAVAQDGGDINFVDYKDGVVFLELRGACSGCPSSTITLKSGIENMLKYYIPEIISVEAINS